MNNESVFTLHDGRRLGYAEYGDPRGFPVLHNHGTPGSRWEVLDAMARAAASLGVRVIVPERPGYGLSDPAPSRTLLDWPRDTAVLMDGLGAKRFAVSGYSMGGMYALACGRALSERVTGIALAGSLAPEVFDAKVLATMTPAVQGALLAARDRPDSLREMMKGLSAAPEQWYAAIVESCSAPDKKLLASLSVLENMYRRSCIESLKHGGESIVRDFMIVTRDWGFPLEAIEQPVNLWHGREDINVPASMSEQLAACLPKATAHWIEGEGHLAFFNHFEAMLRALRS